MNKSVEYIAEVMPDGHLSLPSEVCRQLNLKTHSKVRILVIQENAATSNIEEHRKGFLAKRNNRAINVDVVSMLDDIREEYDKDNAERYSY